MGRDGDKGEGGGWQDYTGDEGRRGGAAVGRMVMWAELNTMFLEN